MGYIRVIFIFFIFILMLNLIVNHVIQRVLVSNWWQ